MIEQPDVTELKKLIGELSTAVSAAVKERAVFVCDACCARTPVTKLKQACKRVDAGYNDMSYYDSPRVYCDYYTIVCPKCRKTHTNEVDTPYPLVETEK